MIERTPRFGADAPSRVPLVAGAMLAIGMVALDLTVVVTALPSMARDLGAIQQVSWVITAYLLMIMVSTPVYGRLGDLYGRRRLFAIAVICFLAGTIASASAQGIWPLVAARGLQGAGAGGLNTLPRAIVADVVPARQLGRYLGYMGAVFAVAIASGPLLGGFIADRLSWRWIFVPNVPLGITALVLVVPRLSRSKVGESGRLDVVGLTLLITAVTCVALVTAWGGSTYGWGSPAILGLLAMAVLLSAAFIACERRASVPLLPLRLLTNQIVNVSLAGTFLVTFLAYGTLFLFPLLMQVVEGVSATHAGLLLMPFMVASVTATAGAGWAITRWGRYRTIPAAGAVLMLVGLVLASRIEAQTGPLGAVLAMMVLGVGIGLVVEVVVIVAQNAVSPRDLGTATSTLMFSRALGGAVGVAAFATVFDQRLGHHVARLVPGGVGAADLEAFRSDPRVIAGLTGGSHDDALRAFTHASHDVFLIGAVFAVLTVGCMLLLKEIPLRETPASGSGSLTGESPAASPR